MKTLLTARWIAPMTRPVIPDGGVVFEAGTILAVGPIRDLRRDHPDARLDDAGDAVVLPGLVNAHAHLELSDCEPGPRPTGFTQWLWSVIARTGPDGAEQRVAQAVARGVDQCLRFGVTTVGDISRHCGLTRPLLKNGPLNVVSYGEVQGLAQRRGLLEERLAAAVDPIHASDHLTIGITPHAPYTVEPHGYRRCLELTRQAGCPLATHLAESPDEAPFLAHHAGPLRELWDGLGWWDDRVPTFEGGPIRYAQSLGLLDYPTLLAHVNYCDDAELDILAGGQASVVYCPRTHAYFGHPPHRWRDMLARGINVAVGTDSCASSPDLNLVDDLRLLHDLSPATPVETLWQLATIRAARALGQEHRLGSLDPGKAADLALFPALFPAHSPDPLRDVLENRTLPGRTLPARQVPGGV